MLFQFPTFSHTSNIKISQITWKQTPSPNALLNSSAHLF